MTNLYQDPSTVKFAIAPMLDWTDRHCRFFHRQLTPRALLYSEMIVADALLHGNCERLLRFHDKEHPIALQLGGSNPHKLAQAAKIAENFGYDEINLNVGCPSNRVQFGTFGACLMLQPDIVADCIAAMKQTVKIPVTVKCRIGVDEQDIEQALDALGEKLALVKVDAIWVHARKAWLRGLSPKENRDIPPLDYERVYRFKQRFPQIFIGINGGIKTVDEARHHLSYVDGIMIGRAAYHQPPLLTELDNKIAFTDEVSPTEIDYQQLIETMCNYCDEHIAQGGRLCAVTRHMIGLFHGLKGARRWRQILSNEATNPNANSDILRRAFTTIEFTDETVADIMYAPKQL